MLTLLVPMDGSPLDGRSLGYAAELATPSGGRLALLSVIPDVALREPTMTRLTEIAEHVRSSVGLRVTTDVRTGDAGSLIAETALTGGVDAIVLVSDRASRLDAWLNGEVAAQVLRTATTPVLIIPPDGVAAPRTPPRILVPVSSSETARRSVALATRLAAASGGEVVLLRVLEVGALTQAQLDTGAERPEEVHPAAAQARADLDALVEALEVPGVRARGLVRLGKPAQTVVATARELQVDLVLVDRDQDGLLAHELPLAGIAMLAPGHA
jgi:nucleotide-binding universal stress UspA family protein